MARTDDAQRQHEDLLAYMKDMDRRHTDLLVELAKAILVPFQHDASHNSGRCRV
jgi:hypothetical protein